MGVTRRIVFPIIRLVLWAVIAVALVKIAFTGADVTTTDTSLQPTGAIVEPTVQVETGTVTNAVTMQASVVADPAVVVKATLAGTVSKLLAADGAVVAVGTPILEIRQETPQDPVVKTDPETGEQTTTERKPKVVVETVKAPVAGTLSLPTLKDQEVSVGDEVGQGRARHAVGQRHADARPAVPAGRRADAGQRHPERRTGAVRLHRPAGRRGADHAAPTRPATARTPSSSGTVSCAIPAGVTAFPGLGATVEITNGSVDDVVVVPISAVQGTVQKGNVWVVGADGEQREAAGRARPDRRQERADHRGPRRRRHDPAVHPGAGRRGPPVDCNLNYDPTVCGG